MIDQNSILSIIDHTLLKAEASKEQIIQLCQEAITYGAATVSRTVIIHHWLQNNWPAAKSR